MTELQKLAERLLQLANDEGTAQIHDVALELARLASRVETDSYNKGVSDMAQGCPVCREAALP